MVRHLLLTQVLKIKKSKTPTSRLADYFSHDIIKCEWMIPIEL